MPKKKAMPMDPNAADGAMPAFLKGKKKKGKKAAKAKK